MAKLGLRGKFILSFSPLIIVILIFGAIGIHTLLSIHKNFSELNRNVTQGAIAMIELKADLLSLEAMVKDNEINRVRITESIDRLKGLAKKHLEHESHNLEQGKKTAHDMMHHAVRIMSLSQYILKLDKTGWGDTESESVHEAIRREYFDLGPILEKHLTIHLQDLAKTEEFIAEKYRQALLIVIFAIGITVLVTFGMLIYLIRSVLGPIKALKEGAKKVGDGNLDYQLAVKTGDELEDLAGEFQGMAVKLAQSHAQLDTKVRMRTRELSEVNAELRNEIAERLQAEKKQRRVQEQVHVLTQELIKVQETERQQIALDLHDNVAQELSSLKALSETVFSNRYVKRDDLQRDMAEWAIILKRCINTVRELSYNLRPPGLEQMGLKSVISDYCRNFTKNNKIQVIFSAAGIDGLQLTYEFSITIYRLVQEALNNIRKHASATHASVKLVASFPNIILRIEDDGQGFVLEERLNEALLEKRLGILGMQERVRLLSGTFRIDSRPRQGTRIFIEIPCDINNGDKKTNTHRGRSRSLS